VGRQQHSGVNINISGCEGEIYWCIEDANKGYEQAKQSILKFIINIPAFLYRLWLVMLAKQKTKII